MGYECTVRTTQTKKYMQADQTPNGVPGGVLPNLGAASYLS
jgi:hypothetical protein